MSPPDDRTRRIDELLAELRRLVEAGGALDALADQDDGYTAGWTAARAGMTNCDAALTELAAAGVEVDDQYRRSFQAGFVARRIEAGDEYSH